jgi:hypothetical protein
MSKPPRGKGGLGFGAFGGALMRRLQSSIPIPETLPSQLA